jgi:HPt (histidine-containing phosphotransfer) domain-containing protein
MRQNFSSEQVDTLLEVFFQESSDLISALRQNIQQAQAVEARRAAHSLKSNARTFGAARLGEQCQQVENLCKAAEFDQAAAQLESLETEYSRAVQALKP